MSLWHRTGRQQRNADDDEVQKKWGPTCASWETVPENRPGCPSSMMMGNSGLFLGFFLSVP